MRFSCLIIACVLTFSGPCFADSTPDIACSVSSKEREKILDLPFSEFDQSEDKGWRPFYAAKCYSVAASLLVAYVERHPKRASAHYILSFHAGQLLAMAGNYEDAVIYLRRGYSDRKSKTVDWNAFVDAHIAFLEKDADKLGAMRARIELQPTMQSGPGVPEWAVGKKINLDVVNGFLACFDEPFAIAYETPCRPEQ